mgnify:CR=1 FL=1
MSSLLSAPPLPSRLDDDAWDDLLNFIEEKRVIPIIGPEPRLPGLWYATGHGRNGILLAGVTGELIAASIGGEPWSDELRAVRATRFWNW